jgi:epoxyqueuosine reductase
MTAVLDAVAIKQRAVRAALDLGAGSVRVTGASADIAARARMTAAFARNDLAAWNYTDAYARTATDPSELLAGARSVICVAMPYAVPADVGGSPLRGRVSNYAWSADYHRELRSLLQRVADVVDEAAGASVCAVACDTRPLAERAFAARAGLGWVGKHTNLISPENGSFVFLGEVVTAIDLPVDEPLSKTCGQCARCVEACPTGALRGDYTLDANRCISDLTQRTGSIPRALRPLVGQWVWGCDLCQLVCPPNAASPVASDRWAPRGEASAPSLVALLHLRSGEFDRRYRGTAMGWRGGAVLRRNAAVALGNALDRSAVEPLRASLHNDPHPMVRGHVAWALGRIGSPAAREALRRQRCTEEDADVREEIDAALGEWQC